MSGTGNRIELVERIKLFEGYRRFAYICPTGHLTIGFGTKIESPGQGVSELAAEFMLQEELTRLRRELRQYPWFWDLDDARQECIIEMAYQLGISGLLRFRKMIAAITEKNFDRAADEALDSLWAQQTPARAQDVARRIRTGSHE